MMLKQRHRLAMFAALCGLLAGIWALTTPGIAHGSGGQTYYVATTGQDSNPGTESAPFRTIQQAANVAQPGDTVLVHQGVYRETVTPAHSGTATAPILYRPYGNEHVVISGADVVSGPWAHVNNLPFTYSTTLSSTFTSSINQAEQLFVDGQALNWARYPSTSPTDLLHPTHLAFESVDTPQDQGNGQYNVTVHDSHLTATQPDFYKGMTIYFLPASRYQQVSGTVLSSSAGTLTFTYNKWYSETDFPKATDPYYLAGSLNALDAPGEWFHDTNTQTLYLRTLSNGNPSSHVVEIKRRDNAFNLDSMSYITVQGFSLFATTITTDLGAADGKGSYRYQTLATANHIVIDHVQVRYPSYFTDQTNDVYRQWNNNTGIVLSGSDNILRNSIIEDSAGNGVTVLGKRNKVLNNIVHDTNYMAIEGGGINTGMNGVIAEDIEIGNNTVYNSGRYLIEFRSITSSVPGAARIHNNDVSGSTMLTADAGALQTWGNDGTGTRIDHNLIRANYQPVYDARGIYIDNGSSHFVIDHNVVWDSQIGLVINYGSANNVVYNNTLVSNDEISLSIPGWDDGNIAANNILTNYNQFSPTVTLKNNLEKGTDPKFADSQHGAFWLTAGSPAIDAGTVISPYTDGYKGSAPDEGAYEFDPQHPTRVPWTAGSDLTLPTPPAPVNLEGTFNNGSMTLQWHNLTHHAQNIVLERSDDGINWFVVATLAPTTTSYVDTNLYGGTYRYRLRTDESPYSNVLTVDTGRAAPALTLMGTYDNTNGTPTHIGHGIGGVLHDNWFEYSQMSFPGNLQNFVINLQTYTGVNAHIQAWIDGLPSNNGTLVADLTVGPSSPQDFSGPYADETAPVLTNPTGTHDLYILITGDLGNIDHFSFTTGETLPAAPSSLQGTAAPGHVANLSWQESTANAGTFQIERSNNGLDFTDIAQVSGSTTSYQDNTVTPGKLYYYRVRALNNVGYSTYSDVITVSFQ